MEVGVAEAGDEHRAREAVLLKVRVGEFLVSSDLDDGTVADDDRVTRDPCCGPDRVDDDHSFSHDASAATIRG
jgi:hypothetical protein